MFGNAVTKMFSPLSSRHGMLPCLLLGTTHSSASLALCLQAREPRPKSIGEPFKLPGIIREAERLGVHGNATATCQQAPAWQRRNERMEAGSRVVHPPQHASRHLLSSGAMNAWPRRWMSSALGGGPPASKDSGSSQCMALL